MSKNNKTYLQSLGLVIAFIGILAGIIGGLIGIVYFINSMIQAFSASPNVVWGSIGVVILILISGLLVYLDEGGNSSSGSADSYNR